MKNNDGLLKVLRTLVLSLILGMSMSANAGLFGLGGTSWKEEVLLHDGQKIIIERSQTYGGWSEPGQSGPIKEHSIRFTVPGSHQSITWVSEYGEDLGRTNFDLLAVHVLNGTPYVVASPNLCLSYNKWGRPNPPYVFFKYDGNVWQRISLEQFPSEFKTINVILSIQKFQAEQWSSMGLVSAEKIKEMNSRTENPERKTILREAIVTPEGRCGEMVRTKNGGWLGIGWFTDQPTREACLNYCKRKEVSAEVCPCKNLFKDGE